MFADGNVLKLDCLSSLYWCRQIMNMLMMSSAWKLQWHETHLIFMSLMEWGLFDFLVRCAHYTDAADIQNIRYNDNSLIIHYSIMIIYINHDIYWLYCYQSVSILFHFKIIGNQAINLKCTLLNYMLLPQQLWAWQNTWAGILFIYYCVIFIEYINYAVSSIWVLWRD